MSPRLGSFTPLFLLLAIGCNTVDPDECWPNTSGGFGGGDTIPIGAGVGATSGGDFGSPQSGPLGATSTPNPCLTPEATTVVKFSPSEFPFVTIIKDDGTDVGGGWQEARANLEFKRIVFPYSAVTWYCPLTIGMPLRTKVMGKVSANRAADLSVEITEGVARTMNYKLPPEDFCDIFRSEVKATFKSRYPDLGSRVTK